MVTTGVPAPANARAHLVQHISQIDNLGLARRVIDGGGAVGTHRGHDEVLGSANACKLQGDKRARHALLGVGVNIAVLGVKRYAKRLKAQDMHVNFAGTKVATTRHGNLRAAKSSQQRTHDRRGCTHLGNQAIGCLP